MFALRLRFVEHKAAATYLQAWGRMNIAVAKYVIAAAEAKEQAKMENQLAALQKRLDDEAKARAKMEEENSKLQQRLLSVRPCAQMQGLIGYNHHVSNHCRRGRPFRRMSSLRVVRRSKPQETATPS